MAYNSTIDKAVDDILIYGNTAKDGSGTSYVPLLDADGHLQLDVLTSGLPSGASTSAKQDTVIGHLDGVEGLLTTIDGDTGSLLTEIQALSHAEDAAHTSTDMGVMALAVRNDTPGTLSNTSGDYTPLQLSAAGALYTHDIVLDNVIGIVGSAAPSSVIVIGAEDSAGDVRQPLMLNTGFDAQPTTDIAMLITNRGFVFNGTTWDRMKGDATDGLLVNLGANNDITGTVTANLSATDNAVLDAIDADLTTIIGHVDGIETLIGTTNSTLTTIDGRVDGIEGLLTTIDADTGAIMTAVQLIDDTIYTAGTDTYTEATSKGQMLLAVRRDADTTLANTTNEFVPLQVDANGYLKVEVFSGATLPVSLTSTTVTGTVAVTQSGTWDEVGINDSGNSITVDAPVGTPAFVRLSDGAAAITTLPVSLASVPSHAVTNAGTFVTQENGAALTAMQLLDDTIFVDDAAFTPATSKVSAIGFLADSTSTDSVDEGDIGIPRMSLDRKVIVTNSPTAELHGLSVFNASSSDGATALTSTAQVIKASAGQVYGWYIYNPNATAQFVQFYNTAAASVTVGTTSPLFMLTIPATSGANVEFTNGITFSNAGFSCAATSTAGGNGAPTTALDAVIFYK